MEVPKKTLFNKNVTPWFDSELINAVNEKRNANIANYSKKYHIKLSLINGNFVKN